MPKSIAFFWCFSCCSSLQTSPQCPENERQALLSFKHNLTNAFSVLSSWMGNDCRKRKGVGCDNNTGQVIELHLWNNNLFGPFLPHLLYLLPNLETLDRSWNSFNGSIPTSFGATFPKLEVLDLTYNELYGLNPATLGNVSTLEVLSLSFNQLSGFIPTSLGKLSNLSGEIPNDDAIITLSGPGLLDRIPGFKKDLNVNNLS